MINVYYYFRYMSFFNTSKASRIIFEKSATYFDDQDTPRLASMLTPDAKIIIILLDPVERAQSWYYVCIKSYLLLSASS